jgi:hypothetical protein
VNQDVALFHIWWAVPLATATAFWIAGLRHAWRGKWLSALLPSVFLLVWAAFTPAILFDGLNIWAAGPLVGLLLIVGAAQMIAVPLVIFAGQVWRTRKVD